MQSLPSINSGSGDSAVVFQLQSIEARGLIGTVQEIGGCSTACLLCVHEVPLASPFHLRSQDQKHP